MFHDIKLDDRSFDEIRDEAISRIVDHCPEWTNHNTSDPGITLVELFAYMTEMTQYRLNQVPQKNYLAFLDLLGIKQRLPIAAKSRVQFELSTGYQIGLASKDTVLIKAGSVLANEGDEENETLVYETNKALYASNVKLLNLYAKSFDEERQKSQIVDYSQNIQEQTPFYPFNSEGKSNNRVEIYLFCDDFYVLQNDVKMSILFRLPTSMRAFDLKEDFLRMMQWEYYDGEAWQTLRISHELSVAVDDNDADILEVTFEGNHVDFEKGTLSQFSEDEQFYIRACLNETPVWLDEFCSYEVSLVTNSHEAGVLPQNCFHNYEKLDMNNNFYPLGSRPGLDDTMLDELFYLRSDDAFCEAGAQVMIDFVHSQSADYVIPKGHDNLQIIWEYAIYEGKWNQLDAKDLSAGFIQQGSLSFTVPSDLSKVVINAEEGYWIRAKMVSGNYGKEEVSEYDQDTGEVKTTPSTLTPPVLSSVRIKYSQPRRDLNECFAFHNYKYEHIHFEKNRPVYFFKQDKEYEEALYMGFDSYLSEQEMTLYFDIENNSKGNLLKGQRVLKWEILQGSQWMNLECEDETDGLSLSGEVRIKLPRIDDLESYTLYIDSFERMWIRVSVVFNAIKRFPRINALLLNTVEITQKKSFYDEIIGHSDGLPDMKYILDNTNLSTEPKIIIGDEEYKAVERFIDFGKSDKVFRFNGITGEIEFGDGIHGQIPTLGEEIIVQSYAVTEGKRGNLPAEKITVLQESINYIDSVKNISECIDGQDGDSIEELKRFAPSVLKTMQRAVSAEDYEHLSRQYSAFVKKAKCVLHEGETVVVIMAQNVLREKGFINPAFIRELQTHLQNLSMITVKPRVESVRVSSMKVYVKLKYSDEESRPVRSVLENELLHKAQHYFDPLTGFKSEGYPIGRRISKNDFSAIVNMLETSCFISEIRMEKEGNKASETGIELNYNEIVNIDDIVIEELSYDF